MTKKVFLVVLALAIGSLVVGFLVVPTGRLLEISIHSYYRNHWLRDPAFFCLQHIRGLKEYPRDTHGPPLHVIVRECLFESDPVCSKALEWALVSGEDPNEVDKSTLGFAPLHYSAYGCDAISANILISNGANSGSQATGGKFKGMTPHEVLMLMAKATCSDSKKKELIENLLLVKGAL